MKPFYAGLFCLALAVFLQVSSLGSGSQSKAFSSAQPQLYGDDYQIRLIQQANALVDYFDQRITGYDTPQPIAIIADDNLTYRDWFSSGPAAGVADISRKRIYLRIRGRTLREIAGTTLHERLHLKGKNHRYIYPLQDQFVNYLMIQGY
jgi:hypothetical protein